MVINELIPPETLGRYIGRGTGGSLGSDPEMFVLNSSGEVIPAFTFLPPQEEIKSQADPFFDGFQAEVNVAPNSCIAYVVDHARSTLRNLQREADKVSGTISFADSVDIPNLKTYGRQHAILGCSPSMNAYGERSPIPKNPGKILWRSAGCHIHVGVGGCLGMKNYDPNLLIQTLDTIIGPVMTSLFAGLETSRRREMYGRAGEYRAKEYGVEWRVPPPAVMMHPILTHISFDAAKAASGLLVNGFMSNNVSETSRRIFDRTLAKIHHTASDAQQVINSCDITVARNILMESKEFYEEFFEWIYGSRGKSVLAFILAGATTKFDPAKYKDYWKLHPHTTWDHHSEGQNCCVARTTFL